MSEPTANHVRKQLKRGDLVYVWCYKRGSGWEQSYAQEIGIVLQEFLYQSVVNRGMPLPFEPLPRIKIYTRGKIMNAPICDVELIG